MNIIQRLKELFPVYQDNLIEPKSSIFVVGTGRSGTHLIGRIIGSHNAIKAFIEEPDFFSLSTEIANGRGDKAKNLELLINRYQSIIKKNRRIILDKSHTNLWIAEELDLAISNAKFVAIIRDVYSTVSSMLLHDGVMHWYNVLDQRLENKFLGINTTNIDYFHELPIESKCALRWLSHKLEIERLNREMNNFYVVDYNKLLIDQESELTKIAAFLNVPNRFKPEKFDINSIDKWKTHLSNENIENINSVLKRNNAQKYII